MRRLLLQMARFGVPMVLIFAALVVAPNTATAADVITISGTATGKTIPLGNGTFRVVGTYRDPSSLGVAGTYSGTYVEQTTGYTSCRLLGFASFFCGTPNFPYACNLISGQLTLRSQGKTVRVLITTDPLGRITSAVCLNGANPEIHDVYFELFNASPPPFSSGYGELVLAIGTMIGPSTPLGGGAYQDTLSLDVTLFPPVQ